MAVTVVIPVWNGLEHVKANFPAVLALGANEIIAIDDASADGVGDHIKKAFPQVKILTNVVNLRFPKSVNKAVKAASGDFIILLNQDVLPDKHLLKNVFPHFSDSRVFAVTFNEQHQSWAKVEINNGRLEHINGELDNQIHHSFWASGAGSAFRKSVWRELGGFDETLTPGYSEDLDLGYRARKRGYDILWEPRAIIFHTPESAYRLALPERTLRYIKERNFLLVQWKNFDLSNLLNHAISLITYILKHPGFIVPVFMAAFHLPRVFLFRLKEKRFIKLSDSEVMKAIN
ncbi:hypothetical protein A2701_03770 [Candidatus Amesbacteria bacterium RIFCSPHIGHO2_01_FULL_47_34]|uniref:Glycosyl transferase, family 2 n=2 Tax=Candidatus Amesiibacteriota TaxID=1752730 RepID=A0A0G1UF33_9BACT|nr:MAG: Glycosyl transferase, family 2 [Candidatus Amesbacteria bacterium GW2011_GWC1_47_15]OGC99665.1 MAG: hypothetical protein A2972_04620 [Candidatus Amesbacteria bacterium RIFCSPLOWO2_01_FULL_47_33]OGD00463.1 MAG: hypothetical protein A2701_03770 [Candidatus Amesbacteria bacterium RIFCSPHIGHO2_01_FULL_47_34]